MSFARIHLHAHLGSLNEDRIAPYIHDTQTHTHTHIYIYIPTHSSPEPTSMPHAVRSDFTPRILSRPRFLSIRPFGRLTVRCNDAIMRQCNDAYAYSLLHLISARRADTVLRSQALVHT